MNHRATAINGQIAWLLAVSRPHIVWRRLLSSSQPQRLSELTQEDVLNVINSIATQVDDLCDVSHPGIVYYHKSE